MKKFNRFFDSLIDSLAFIAGSFIFIMMLIECYEVIARYCFGQSLLWGVEVSEYMLFLLAFLGTAWVLKKRAHISVDIFFKLLKPRSQIRCNLFVSFMGIMVSLVIFFFGLKTAWEDYVAGVRIVKTTPVPSWIFLSFIPLGYLLLLTEFIRQFLDELKQLGLRKKKN
jgi:C4-dicarboxylate transporter DctQ subunit